MYKEMREKFLNKEITEKEWNDFCTVLLFEEMQTPECRGVFERLAKI